MLCGTENGMWSPFQPFNTGMWSSNAGGGMSRNTFSLQQCYQAGKASLATWSIPTDGMDLARYRGTTITLYPNRFHSYVFSWETDFGSLQSYSFNWYHPARVILQKQHVVMPSLLTKPNGKPKKIRIKPPAALTSEWYMMYAMAKIALFKWQCSFIDIENPYMNADEATLIIKIRGHDKQNAIQNFNYLWFADTGEDNRIGGSGDAPNEDSKIGLGAPYWLSLYSAFNAQNWVFMPTDTQEWTGHRIWVKLEIASQNAIIRNGPYVPKASLGHYSIGFKYKSHFQFGGPSPTEGINQGQDPATIPPKATASSQFFGLETRDPSKVGKGVMHPWEIRRGLLTKRGLARLIQSSDSEITHPESEQEETEPSLSEEEPLSEEAKKALQLFLTGL